MNLKNIIPLPRRKYQHSGKTFLTHITKYKFGYRFYLRRTRGNFTYQYPTKFEAMVEYDFLIKMYKLDNKPFFPLACTIPDKYNLSRKLAA